MIQSESDADTQIVSAAIALASDRKHTTVIADDTDIIVLLFFHWNAEMTDIVTVRMHESTKIYH